MRRYADLGIEVHITEMDVRCSSDPNKCPYSEEWPQDALEK